MDIIIQVKQSHITIHQLLVVKNSDKAVINSDTAVINSDKIYHSLSSHKMS